MSSNQIGTTNSKCPDEGNGTKDCPYRVNCKQVSYPNNVSRVECDNPCQPKEKVIFSNDKRPGTTPDRAQKSADNMYYMSKTPIQLNFPQCPTGYQRSDNGECCTAGWTSDCDQNCAKKRCEDAGYIWNAHPDVEYWWNAYKCCPPGACPFNSKRDPADDTCKGDINNNPNYVWQGWAPYSPIYPAERSRDHCIQMGLQNWKQIDNRFQCNNIPVSQDDQGCNWRIPNQCVLRDYVLDGGQCKIPDQPNNIFPINTNMSELDFTNQLRNTYAGNKAGADNVYEYVQRCQKVPGYQFLTNLNNLQDPNSDAYKQAQSCNWRDSSKCIFRDYKKQGDACNVDGYQGYSTSGLAGYDQNTLDSWLEGLYQRDDGPDKNRSEAPNVRDYVQRCQKVPGYEFLSGVNMIGPNNECAIMSGPWIKTPGLVDKIAYIPTGEKVYLKLDDGYTKMVTATSGECRYYSGQPNQYRVENWNNYTLAQPGVYTVRIGTGNECTVSKWKSRDRNAPGCVPFNCGAWDGGYGIESNDGWYGSRPWCGWDWGCCRGLAGKTKCPGESWRDAYCGDRNDGECKY